METDERATAEDARWGGWMAAAQSGDAIAYRKLLEELLPVVRSWVRSRLFDAALARSGVLERKPLRLCHRHLLREQHLVHPPPAGFLALTKPAAVVVARGLKIHVMAPQ